MRKSEAIKLLGGTVTAAADSIGISTSAVSQWPEELPPSIRDRVQAAIARRHLPPELIGDRPNPTVQTIEPLIRYFEQIDSGARELPFVRLETSAGTPSADARAQHEA